MDGISKLIGEKILQWTLSFCAGMVAAFEATIIYAGLCFLAIAIDIISAWCLSRRIHKKNPKLSDGKFKSSYKYRVLLTLIVVQLALMLAYHVDTLVMGGGHASMNFVIVAFLFYQGWSVAENWSSENTDPRAKIFQKIMINKAERHFNVKMETKEEEKENETEA